MARPFELDGQGVAMFCKGYEVYGIGSILKLYARSFPRMLFVASQEGALTEWLRERSAEVLVSGSPASFRMTAGLGRFRGVASFAAMHRSARALGPPLRDRGVRIVHTHWPVHQVVAGFLRRQGMGSVWQINNYFNRGRAFALRAAVHRSSARWGADLLLPASGFVAEDWTPAPRPIRIFYNAAEPHVGEVRRLPAEPVRCISAGRLTRDKGHHIAVEAILELRAEGLPFELDVAGGPLEGNSYAAELRARVTQAGAADAIRFLGFRDDLRDLHADAHVGLQCRIDPEPCSVWVCEALRDGLCVVASATGGTPELVDDGVTGLLYPAGDARALAGTLRRLWASGDVDGFRQRAHSVAAERFSRERFAQDGIAAYRALNELRGWQ